MFGLVNKKKQKVDDFRTAIAALRATKISLLKLAVRCRRDSLSERGKGRADGYQEAAEFFDTIIDTFEEEIRSLR